VLKIGRDGERKHSALHRAFRLRYFFDFFPLLALALMAAWAAANPGYSPQRHRDHRENQEENEVNTFFRLWEEMQGAQLIFVNSADFSVFSVPLW
jgi:hypothetical protein